MATCPENHHGLPGRPRTCPKAKCFVATRHWRACNTWQCKWPKRADGRVHSRPRRHHPDLLLAREHHKRLHIQQAPPWSPQKRRMPTFPPSGRRRLWKTTTTKKAFHRGDRARLQAKTSLARYTHVRHSRQPRVHLHRARHRAVGHRRPHRLCRIETMRFFFCQHMLHVTKMYHLLEYGRTHLQSYMLLRKTKGTLRP